MTISDTEQRSFGKREVHYGEGIFVGYRYYDHKQIAPLFPFGHGLTYTTFEYGDLRMPEVVAPGEPVPVSVAITNTGRREAGEVVQLYVHDDTARLVRPEKELKRFAKITLKPGESTTVNFELDERALAFYDSIQRAWIAEPGRFEVLVGSSSRDIRVRAGFTLSKS